MVKLGDRARDKVSGFEGIVVAHHKFLTGCDRFSLESKHFIGAKSEDWEELVMVKYQTFDVTRLEIIEADAIKLEAPEPLPSGNAPG